MKGCTDSASIQRATPYRPLEQEAGTREGGSEPDCSRTDMQVCFFCFVLLAQILERDQERRPCEDQHHGERKICPARRRRRDFSHLPFKTVNL